MTLRNIGPLFGEPSMQIGGVLCNYFYALQIANQKDKIAKILSELSTPSIIYGILVLKIGIKNAFMTIPDDDKVRYLINILA